MKKKGWNKVNVFSVFMKWYFQCVLPELESQFSIFCSKTLPYILFIFHIAVKLVVRAVFVHFTERKSTSQ